MKNIILYILMTICFTSCKTYTKFDIENLPLNDTIYHLDISNRNFKKQPDLSKYTIVKLNISKNKIREFDENKLPKGLDNLNFSSNKLKGHVYFKTKNNFENLNFSKNKIEKFAYGGIAKNLNLSNNQLKSISLLMYNDKRADTLNVANNKDLETKFYGFPKFYKHLINYTISTKN